MTTGRILVISPSAQQIPKVPKICPRCGAHLLRSYDERICSKFCGFTEQIITTVPPLRTYVEEPALKPLRRIHGISAKESRRIYRNSPAGKAAWLRYRRSTLFDEAHARHRTTQRYKDTQTRYYDKQRLFRKLLRQLDGDKDLESTCPLNLFYKGPNDEIYHNREICDFKDGDCMMKCLNEPNGAQVE